VIDGIHFFAHRLEPLLLSAMTCNSRPERWGLPVTKEEFDTETESPQQKKLDAAPNPDDGDLGARPAELADQRSQVVLQKSLTLSCKRT